MTFVGLGLISKHQQLWSMLLHLLLKCFINLLAASFAINDSFMLT